MMHFAMNTFTYIGEIVDRIKKVEDTLTGVSNMNEVINDMNSSIDGKNLELQKNMQALQAERTNYVTQLQLTSNIVIETKEATPPRLLTGD